MSILVGNPADILTHDNAQLEPHQGKTCFFHRENKGEDQLHSSCMANQCLCFRNIYMTYFLNSVFKASNSLYSPVYDDPGRKP